MPKPSNPIEVYIDSDERFAVTPEALDFFKLLEDPSNMYFSQHADVFIACMAIGISYGKFTPDQGKDTIMILSVYRSRDPQGIFPLLVKALHPELDKKQLADRMEDYAIAGVEYLKQQYEKLGRIDYEFFKDLAET